MKTTREQEKSRLFPGSYQYSSTTSPSPSGAGEDCYYSAHKLAVLFPEWFSFLNPVLGPKFYIYKSRRLLTEEKKKQNTIVNLLLSFLLLNNTNKRKEVTVKEEDTASRQGEVSLTITVKGQTLISISLAPLTFI